MLSITNVVTVVTLWTTRGLNQGFIIIIIIMLSSPA